MYIDFSLLFHQSSKDLVGGGSVRIPNDTSLWPPEWTTTYYKTYDLQKIMLPGATPHADLFDTIRNRSSGRAYSSKPLSLSQMSTLLKYSCGIVSDSEATHKRRAQPSGGARYPIEVYAIVFHGSVELPAGMYHYNVKEHALDVLHEKKFTPEERAEIVTYPFAQKASCLIVMTAVFYRNQMKYGERGYRYIMLEAGHIGQNIYLVSEALDLQCCGLGGTRDEHIEKLIGVDGAAESVLYGIVVG